MIAKNLTRSHRADEPIGVASGRLVWVQEGDALVAGRYRVELLGPERWETTYRGQHLHVDPHRRMALAGAEHHHREVQRIVQIKRWGALAALSLVVAFVSYQWFHTLQGFTIFSVSVWAFLSSGVRCQAAANRSLLDPYRTRERWEPSDWWNH